MATEEIAMPTVWPPGTRVQVRNSFDGRWASGFEVADVCEEAAGATSDCGTAECAYHLLRRSDHAVLPAVFPATRVRPAR
jgi:hypothetical protein